MKYLVRCLGVLLLLVTGLIAGLTLTVIGRGILASTISSLASSDKVSVQLTGISGIWSGDLSVKQITVADNSGTWLSLDGARIIWAPLKLLTAKFEASAITLLRVELLRRPNILDNQSANSGEFSLPVSVAVQDIRIDELVLGKNIAGSTARLKLDGQLVADTAPVQLDGRVNASRTDEIAGSLQISATYRPTQDIAELSASINESPNGILSHLLQLEDVPQFEMNVSGTGPIKNWRLDSTTKLDGIQVLDIIGNLATSQDGQRGSLFAIGDPAKLLPPQYRELIGNNLNIEIDFNRLNTGKIDLSHAKIDADRFSLTAHGVYDPMGKNAITGEFSSKDAALSMSDGIVAGLKNFAIRSADISISGTGNKAIVQATALMPQIDTGGISVADLNVSVQAPQFDLQHLTGQFSGVARAGSIESPNNDLAKALTGVQDVDFNGSISESTLSIESFEFKNPVLGVAANAEYNRDNNSWHASFNAKAASSALPDKLAVMVGEALIASGQLEGTNRTDIQIDNFSLNGGPISGSGSGKITNKEIAAELKLKIASIKGLIDGLDVKLASQLNIDGPIEKPRIDFSLDGEDLIFAEHRGENLKLVIEGLADFENPDIAIKLGGTVDGVPLSGDTRLHVKSGNRVLENIHLENGVNSITGELVFDDKFMPEGVIDINLPQLGPLAALALQKVFGGVAGSATFSHVAQIPVVEVRLQSAGIQREDLKISDMDIAVKIHDYRNAPKPMGNVDAARIISGTTVVDGFSLNFDQQGDWTGFDVVANINKIPLNANGNIRVGEQIDIEITNAEAVVQSIDLSLSQTAKILVENGTINISDVELGIGDGKLQTSGSVGEKLNLSANITNVDGGLINQFTSSLGASGLVSGQVEITGSSTEPIVNYDLKLQRVATKHTRELAISALNISSTGTFAEDQLNFDSATTNSSGLKIDGGGKVVLAKGVKLDLAFAGKLPFALLAKQLSAQGIVLDGNASIELGVSGSSDKPAINGKINTSKARFVHAQSGIAINGLALDLVMADEKIRIKRMGGELSTGGRVSAEGDIDISSGRGFPADIALRVKDGVYTDHLSVSSKFNANMRVGGSLVSDPIISGSVNLKRTTVTIPERIPSSIAKLNIQHKNANAEISKQAAGLKPVEKSSAKGLRLDLDIKAPGQIYVRGRGLDAELGGELKLTNSLSNPQALGAFQFRRGRLSILGKRLDFTRGELNFNGSLVPELAISAETQRDEYTIIIDVVGPADNPEFEFSSSPALGEDEVLAQLVFGKDVSSLSALQIVKLGQAAATLTGKGGNSSMLDKFRDLIRADDLDVKTDEKTGETTVGVGRYLNDKTYIGVERGTDAGTGKATIDLSIGKGVKLRGEATEDGNTKAGIFYQKDY
ncbi:MAG: hypothetical protein GY742_09610 [Hyphomicrobiales bacterium]|nr:hypothetical protein [Hyphomicrobiales bacterium]